MKRLVSAVKYDIKFQFRHGFYAVYLLFTVLYSLCLRGLPQGIRLPAAVIIVLSDPGILGFFLIGAIVMLERGQNLYSCLFATPLRTTEYLAAKVISLGTISFISSLIICSAGLGRMVNLVYFLPGIFLPAAFFTLVGFAPALKFRSLPAFLLLAPVYIIVFFAPVLFYLGISDLWLFYLLPTTGAMLLIEGSLLSLSWGQYFYSVTVLLVWLWAAWSLAGGVLGKHIVQEGRTGK